jgi:hypothetical protein
MAVSLKCPQCSRPASGAIFVPSLADTQYAVAVCDRHDLMGDGERFTLNIMRGAAAAFLSAVDRQTMEGDEALREWLVEAANGAGAHAAALTVSEAGERENLSQRAVQRLCASDALGAGAWRTGPGQRAVWRIDPAALVEWRRRPQQPDRTPRVAASDVTRRRRSGSVVW